MNSNWVGAGHLKIGDKIKQADGTTGVVANVVTIQQTQEMFNLTVDEAHTFYVGTNGWLVHNCDEWAKLFNPDDVNHILHGTGTRPGGGHLWPGVNGATPFPKSWDGNKILGEVANIITDPNTQWYSATRTGEVTTKAGTPAFHVAWEVRDGVRMRVVWELSTGKVITAVPDMAPLTKGY